jgi:hypothetical protein
LVESALPFSSWESYYVIIGSSAAALTGLNFVVIALGAESKTIPSPGTVNAFATPTIVHFCAVLLVSALLSAPWHSTRPVDIGFGACGIAGMIYVLLVMRRALRQTVYQPVLEDVIWHWVLPFVAYAAFLIAAIILNSSTETSLFIVAGSSLLLLYIGIHNAWDTVVWMAIQRKSESPDRAT